MPVVSVRCEKPRGVIASGSVEPLDNCVVAEFIEPATGQKFMKIDYGMGKESWFQLFPNAEEAAEHYRQKRMGVHA